jgi:dihydroflavonol-4-reductase
VRALVLGAGGFLGLNLVEALMASGEVPLCGRRARTNALALRRLRVPMVPADLDQPAQLAMAMAGCDTVFHLAGHYPRLSLDAAGTLETGMRQIRHALDAAAASGVGRFIYVSSTATVAAAKSGPSTEFDVYATVPPFGPYHAVKWSMEQAVLAERRMEVVVVCPGACLGPWDLKVGTSAVAVALARGMDPPHPDGVINLADVRDVAAALHRLARQTAPPRRVLLAAHNLTLHGLLERLARWYGVAPPSPPLSALAARELADAEERASLVTRCRPRLSREIVDLVVHGAPLDASLARETLGLAWTPLEVSLQAFDAWALRLQILPTPLTEEQRT